MTVNKHSSFFIVFCCVLLSLSSYSNPTYKNDSLLIKESFNQEDIGNEYLSGALKPIRKNFKRINSISKWSKIIVIDISNLSEASDGAEAHYYYKGNKLEKIIARYFGESSQILVEYYLIEGELSFVYEKLSEYNRPIYYDSVMMKENEDSEVFDFSKSEITTTRSYFSKGKLLHQLSDEDIETFWFYDYFQGQSIRIQGGFNKLLMQKPQ